MKYHSRLLTPVISLLFSSLLHAEVVPGRWEKVDAQSVGTELTIISNSGQRITGTFAGSDQESLMLIETDWTGKRIPKSEVARVQTKDKFPDPVWDGVLLGIGIGLIPGLLFQGEVEAGGSLGAYYAFGLLASGGLGYLDRQGTREIQSPLQGALSFTDRGPKSASSQRRCWC